MRKPQLSVCTSFFSLLSSSPLLFSSLLSTPLLLFSSLPSSPLTHFCHHHYFTIAVVAFPPSSHVSLVIAVPPTVFSTSPHALPSRHAPWSVARRRGEGLQTLHPLTPHHSLSHSTAPSFGCSISEHPPCSPLHYHAATTCTSDGFEGSSTSATRSSACHPPPR